MKRIALLLAVVLTPAASQAQRLQQVSRAVREGRGRERPSNDNNPSGRRAEPRERAPSRWRWNLSRRYLSYPYALGVGGFELPGVDSADTRGTASVVTLEGGLVLPELARGSLSVRAIFGAIEVELRGSALAEPVAQGVDWAGIVGVRGAWAFTEGGPARARVMAGMISYLDARGDVSGAEMGFGVDVFPGAPWVLSGEFTGGVLGRAGLLNGRASLGVLFGRTEVLVSWSHLWLLPFEDGVVVDLGGPSLGLRAWL